MALPKSAQDSVRPQLGRTHDYRNFLRGPLWRSRFRIQCCHCSSSSRCWGTGLIPSLGTSVGHGRGKPSLFNQIVWILSKTKKKQPTWYFRRYLSLTLGIKNVGMGVLKCFQNYCKADNPTVKQVMEAKISGTKQVQNSRLLAFLEHEPY